VISCRKAITDRLAEPSRQEGRLTFHFSASVTPGPPVRANGFKYCAGTRPIRRLG
jgi:hypothetical protein